MKSIFYYSILLLIICSGTVSCKRSSTLFESLSASKTGVHFQNNLPTQKGFNILYYLYYYEGGGVATGDINNDGLPDIYFTANTPGNNKLYLNKGNFSFEDITTKAGVQGISDWCSGVTMADVNADGWMDIYVCAVSGKFGLKGHNQLFINNGNNTFTDKSKEFGLDFETYAAQAAFFDMDQDGDLDCYLLNESDRPNQNIVDTSNRRKYDPHTGDKLLRNDTYAAADKKSRIGSFTDISATAGIYQSNLGYGLGLAVGDLNNDGWEDIYIGNDFHENDYYYINNKNGTFTESGAKHFNHYSRFSMGNDIADYNNDGHLDVVTVDMLPPDEKILKTYGSDEKLDIYSYKLTKHGFQHQYSKNCLQRNNGSGKSFSETALQSGVAASDWSWCPLFADFDNDGNKDLFITSGIVKRTTDLDYVRFISNAYMQKQLNSSANMDEEAIAKMPDGISHSFIYKGDGNINFEDKSKDWGFEKNKGYFNGAAYADLDNDGNLDLVVNAINAPAQIYKNNAPKKNYLSIQFKGDSLNTSGIGCKAYVFTKNKMQYQQLMLTRGFQSCSDSRLHFGLDSTTTIDSILVVWPNQQMQLLKNISANKLLTFNKKDAVANFNYDIFFPTPKEPFTDITSSVKLNWQHKENIFNDFNVQYLIPHQQSTRGPKLAVADINGDGLDDFYVCGAAEQAGSLMQQTKDGGFTAIDTATFGPDKLCEDVDATFVDVNGDSYVDLYVVSGGNQLWEKNVELLDRLYLNDGKGHFTKSTTALPAIYENKSCVSYADIDKDGDNDIFVGTLANPHAFGIPQTSHLFINDSKGNFSIANNQTITLESIGVVTSATFTDLNKDGQPDLVVGGEWMPITIFMNHNGVFQKTSIANASGLWQTIYADDVNKDGNMDLLCGNWGWNNKFYSGKNGPARLYVSDFDKNGQVEQLLSYTAQGTEYPFLAKDEVEMELPLLKKHYLRYADYAGVPMQEVFYGWVDTVKPYTAERLGSAVFYGNGKGGFTIQDLPSAMQMAPLFSFTKWDNTSGSNYMCLGNFYGVIPYEGRYDALYPTLFTYSSSSANFKSVGVLANQFGEVRDTKWIRYANGKKVLIIAKNNAPLSFLEIPE